MLFRSAVSITSGSPPLRLRTAGTVTRFIGAETGVARLVEVSMVKVVDIGADLSRGASGCQSVPFTEADPPAAWQNRQCKRGDWEMAERVGFEPTVPVKAQRFSRPSQSTTLAPLREVVRSVRGAIEGAPLTALQGVRNPPIATRYGATR